MRKIKDSGFTLLEVIISVAALSLISVFILQMFLAASNLNEKAKNFDIAFNLTVSHIENLKSFESMTEYISKCAPAYEPVSGDTVTVSFYYGDDWSEMGYEAAEKAKYCMEMYMVPETRPSGNGGAYGQIYNVQATVIDVSQDEDSMTLAALQTKKYFPAERESADFETY